MGVGYISFLNLLNFTSILEAIVCIYIILTQQFDKKINPRISAYTQVHVTFDFNKTPVAPTGCKVVFYDRTDERSSWANHGTKGYYVGPVMKYF